MGAGTSDIVEAGGKLESIFSGASCAVLVFRLRWNNICCCLIDADCPAPF